MTPYQICRIPVMTDLTPDLGIKLWICEFICKIAQNPPGYKKVICHASSFCPFKRWEKQAVSQVAIYIYLFFPHLYLSLLAYKPTMWAVQGRISSFKDSMKSKLNRSTCLLGRRLFLVTVIQYWDDTWFMSQRKIKRPSNSILCLTIIPHTRAYNCCRMKTQR